MIKLDGMLMIGSTECNIGKTQLACEFLRKFSRTHCIVGIKVTPITASDGQHLPDSNCRICSSLDGAYSIIEETNTHSNKDTARLLRAGAGRVFWLRVVKERLLEGLTALVDIVGSDTISICESNLLRLVVEPGLFLLVTSSDRNRWKSSALKVQEHADRIVFSENNKLDFDPNQVRILDGRWVLVEKATAIVLAGGASQRMGTDKSMLPMRGRPIIENICGRLHGGFQQILISANDTDKFAFLGFEIVRDRISDQGPLMGIASALEASVNELNFIVACDIPHIELPLIRRMLSQAAQGSADVVIPITCEGYYEPLYAIYRKNVAELMNEELSRNRRKLTDILSQCEVEYVELHTSLPNLNTISEYRQFQKESIHCA
jgi:molybdopterin-guanine dinucleotide biosynthesis protein A